MAVITITIKDDGTGGCSMGVACDVDVPENDDDCTPSMVTGALVMQLFDQLRLQAEAEDEGE